MKKLLIGCALVGLMMGCGNAKMVDRAYHHETGKLISEKYIKVNRLGSSKLAEVSIGLQKGTAKIGQHEGDAGGVGTAIEKLVDRVPIP